jgi:hypothetical protein
MPGFFRVVRGAAVRPRMGSKGSDDGWVEVGSKNEAGKRRSPAALERASRASFGKLAFVG